MGESLDEVYAEFRDRFGPTSSRSRREVRALVQAADRDWSQVDAAFWSGVSDDWLSGRDDLSPFADDARNVRYRTIAMQIGLLD